MAQGFTLDLVEGELLIRDAAAPLALENPTTITGTHDTGEGGTGAITGGAFSTPSISFQTVAQGFDVFVDASFSQVGSSTGSIDADGNVTINTALNVDLDVEVSNPPILTGDCRATPVNLTLESTAPWDPTTKTVTVADADFSIPSITATPQCIDVIANGINDQLAGNEGGHSLSMSLQGDLMLPTAPACKTLTTVEITPAGQSRLGDQVTFTATVTQDPAFANDPACDDVENGQIPTGLVEFKAGTTLLGTAALDGSGVATFTTDDITAGTFAMTAGYRGEPPFGKSTSPAVTYKIATKPAITADLPDVIVIDADPVELDVTITNTGLGSAVTNARLQMNLQSLPPVGGSVTPLTPTDVEMEYWNGAAWVPVTETGTQPTYGAVSPATGFPLPSGTEVVRKVRLGINQDISPVTPKPVDVTFEVAPVDPGTGLPAAGPAPSADVVGSTTGRLLVIEATRRATTTTATVVPHTLRQGQTVRIDQITTSGSFDNNPPGGTYSVLLDGRSVLIRENSTPNALGHLPSLPAGTLTHAEFPIPDDAPTGVRTITLRYSGNEFYEPSEWTTTIHVMASRGTTYRCASSFLDSDLFYVNLTARASIGSVRPSGSAINLAGLDVALYSDRGDTAGSLGFFFNPDNPVVAPETVFGLSVNGISFGFGDLGEGTAAALTVANNFPMNDSTRPVDPNPDMAFGFREETASVTVAGDPGDVVPIDVEQVKVNASFWAGGTPFPLIIDCTPVSDAARLGEVTIAGTVLTVDAPTVTREGDSVSFATKVFPVGTAGTVEILDGAETLTVAQVRSDGTATYATDALAVGTHHLTARFFSGLAASSTTSAPVTLEVLPEHDCEAFTEEGHGAVVRLVYLELLGRCPDQAGYDHWVGRLEGGTSAEAFARTISRTNEAVGRVVDDAYETMLGRAPDAGGRTFWIGRLQANGRYDQLLADLAGSGEFWSLSGSTNTGFVTRVYERLLDRAPDQGGLDYWVGRLDAGTSRKVLVRSLANQDEPLSRIVTDSYQEILGRTPATSERTNAIDDLRQTGDRPGLYAELIGRPEFATRAGTLPNPED